MASTVLPFGKRYAVSPKFAITSAPDFQRVPARHDPASQTRGSASRHSLTFEPADKSVYSSRRTDPDPYARSSCRTMNMGGVAYSVLKRSRCGQTSAPYCCNRPSTTARPRNRGKPVPKRDAIKMPHLKLEEVGRRRLVLQHVAAGIGQTVRSRLNMPS